MAADAVANSMNKNARKKKTKTPAKRNPAKPHPYISRASVVKKGPDPFPTKIHPMLATASEKPFDRPRLLFRNSKWDGYRAIASSKTKTVRLVSRNPNDLTAYIPNRHPPHPTDAATPSRRRNRRPRRRSRSNLSQISSAPSSPKNARTPPRNCRLTTPSISLPQRSRLCNFH